MKTKRLKSILIIVAILSILISTISFATSDASVTSTSTGTNNTNNEVATTSDTDYSNLTSGTPELEKHEGDYFTSGSDITIDKAIDGNAYVFGNTVKVTGQINGDLFVLATTSVSIEKGGSVYGNVFAITPNLTLDGVLYNLYTLTDNFVCKYDGMAALDLKVLAKTIDFSGYVERNVYFKASDSLTLKDDAYITGNLHYTAKNANISDKATIKGSTNNGETTGEVVNATSNIISGYTMSFITSLTFILVVLLLILLVKPGMIEHTTKNLTNKPFKTLGLGLLAFVLVPVLAAICFIIDSLSSVGMVLAIVYIALIVLSTIIVTIGLANFLDNKFKKTHSELSILAYVLIVALALWVLAQIPYLGIFINVLVWIFGLGTIVVAILPARKETNKEAKIDKNKKEKTSEPKKEEIDEDKTSESEEEK